MASLLFKLSLISIPFGPPRDVGNIVVSMILALAESLVMFQTKQLSLIGKQYF